MNAKTTCLLLAVTLVAAGVGSAQAAPKVFILAELDKPTGSERLASSPDFLKDGVVTLHAAGNEVVAFQVLLQAYQDEAGLDVRVSDLVGPATLDAAGHVQRFLAYYVRSRDASYSWFLPATAGVLPWRGIYWPDALIPFTDPYSGGSEPVATPFAIHPRDHRNQAVWIDVFIPKDAPAGVYRGSLEVLQNGAPLQAFPIALTVHPFNLPDQTHVDAFGELYRENGVMFDSGVKFKLEPEKDWPIYRRYVQMAHAHRFTAAYRAECGPLPYTPGGDFADAADKPWSDNWDLYAPYVGSILSGEAFTAKQGYVGPCAETPPAFYPAPFIEKFYGADSLRKHLDAHDGKIDPELLKTFRANAAAFWKLAEKRNWQNVRFFAYIMDEVDAGQDTGAAAGNGAADVVRFHEAMRQIQSALDEGAGGKGRIRLLWTSHADAAQWRGTPADLADIVSWWVPNAHALDVPFYQDILKCPGETVWFYHSGHPAVGNHTINQLGIDMALWGLLCRRYQVNGSFLWSMMSFPASFENKEFIPYNHPSYKTEDTRWGNGVLFYPGSRLTTIGMARNVAGPIPSLRMKAYRRGLQDYEYCWLARERGRGAEADALLKELIPAAFSEAPEGRAQGRWSQDPADYERLRARLADLIAPKVER